MGRDATPPRNPVTHRSPGLDDYRSINALAEAVNAAYKSELIVSGRPWRTVEQVEQVELATMDWVWWFNHHRLHQQLGYRTPVEYEAAHTGTSHHASRPIPAPAPT